MFRVFMMTISLVIFTNKISLIKIRDIILIRVKYYFVGTIPVKDKSNYMSQDTFAQVLIAIPSLKIRKWPDEDIQMLFKILYWCAFRPMEGIARSKEDFNLDEREVYLGHTKTINNDKAPIPSLFIAELRQWLLTKPDGPLFPGLTYDTAYRWFVKLGKQLNIPAWTIPQSKTREKTKGHIFRKSLGKDMLEGTHGKKFSIPIISKQLRHAKPSITQDHYLKASIEAVKEAW